VEPAPVGVEGKDAGDALVPEVEDVDETADVDGDVFDEAD
jgi:hypothetical protein